MNSNVPISRVKKNRIVSLTQSGFFKSPSALKDHVESSMSQIKGNYQGQGGI